MKSKAFKNVIKLNDYVSVTDYGAVADAVYTGTTASTGTVAGTDNLAAFNAALAAAAADGVSAVYVPGGRYRLSAKLTIPRGVVLVGDGSSHLAYVLTGNADTRGTVLFIAGASGDDCLAFSENTGHGAIAHLSVYNTTAGAVRSVCAVIGVLYGRMVDVEIGSVQVMTGVGLYLRPSTTGVAYETLWCSFQDVVAQTNLRYGLKIESTGVAKVCNANTFIGGQYVGAWGGLLIDGSGAGTENINNVFHGVKFDAIWDGTFTPTYRAAAQNVFGWLTNNCYIWPIVTLKVAKASAFYGCYFEAVGAPTTFNDGVNGSATLLATIWLDNPTTCVATGVYDAAYNSAYLYDNGSRSIVTPTTDGWRHDNSISVSFLARDTNSQTIPASVWTTVEFDQVLRDSGNHLEWDGTANTVKVRQPGMYLITGTVVYDGWATANDYGSARIDVDGFFYAGTTALQSGASNDVSVIATVVAPLARGDTIKLQTLQNSAGNQTLNAGKSTFSVVKC